MQKRICLKTEKPKMTSCVAESVNHLLKLKMHLSRLLKAIDHPYMKGKGGRLMNNSRKAMQGTDLASLKHHLGIQPLFAIFGTAITLTTAFALRKCVYSNDINWVKTKDLEDGGFYREQPKLINVDWEEQVEDRRSRPNYKD